MNRLLSFLALILLTPLALASDTKTVYGYLTDSNDPRVARQLTSATTSETVNNSLQFHFPRWDGKDANGNFIGYERLEKVRFEVCLNMATREWGENTASIPQGWWQVNNGLVCYWSRVPDFTDVPTDTPLAFGGGQPITWTDAGHSIAGFDGTLDGAGPSGHYAHLVGQPTFQEDTFVSNALMRELRAWSGPTGSMGTTYLNVRSFTQTMFPGHWSSWGDTTFYVRDLWGAPAGAKLAVQYTYSTEPTPTRRIVEQGPWIEIAPMVVDHLAPERSLTLPGYSGPAGQLSDVRLEQRTDYWSHFWLENLSGFNAVCGGGAVNGMAVAFNGYQINGMGLGYNAQIGSGNTEVEAFDGNCDFGGESGFYRYASSVWPGSTAFQVSENYWPNLAALSGPSIDLTVSTPWDAANAVAITPGADFAWGHRGVIGGRVRAVFFRTP
jgi:hypothetical protein